MGIHEKLENIMSWLIKIKADELWFKWIGWCMISGTLAALAQESESLHAKTFLLLCATFSILLIYFNCYITVFTENNIQVVRDKFHESPNLLLKTLMALAVLVFPGTIMATIYTVVKGILSAA